MFATLGFTAENADELRAALLKAAASNDAQAAASDQFGDRFSAGLFALHRLAFATPEMHHVLRLDCVVFRDDWPHHGTPRFTSR